MKRLIVTDSTSEISKDLARQSGIVIMPVQLLLDGSTYRDGVDIQLSEFYRNFSSYQSMSTAATPYEDYALAYLKWVNYCDEVLVIHCSSHLSETYRIACRVHESFQKKHRCRVEIVDSRLCGMGLGLVVLAAARAFREGDPMGLALKKVNQAISKTTAFLAIPTLKYLRKNKKISGLKSLIGSAIGVKPIIGFEEGKLTVVNRLFGEQKNMILAMFDTIKADIGRRPISLAIEYAKDDSLVNSLKRAFESTFDCREIHIAQFSPSIGISTGPETIGVAYTVHGPG